MYGQNPAGKLALAAVGFRALGELTCARRVRHRRRGAAAHGKRQGEAGAVVDGAVRDIDRSRAIGAGVQVHPDLARSEQDRLKKLEAGIPLAELAALQKK